MACYDYKCRCASCLHEFEVFQVASKDRDKFQVCPKCKGDAYRIPVNKGHHFVTIGKGFYGQGFH